MDARTIPDSVREAADLTTFTCIEGTRAQQAFCTYFSTAQPSPLDAGQFLTVLRALEKVVFRGIIIDPAQQPEICRSPLYLALQSLEGQPLNLTPDIITAMACHCFAIDESHEFIGTLRRLLTTEADALLLVGHIIGSESALVEIVVSE